MKPYYLKKIKSNLLLENYQFFSNNRKLLIYKYRDFRMKKRILVTGAGGYIGCILTEILLEKGYKVRAVDRYFFGKDLVIKNPDLEIIQDDTRFFKESYLEGVDSIIDLAAISNDPSGELFQKATWDINHLARVNLAKMAKESGIDRYILPSSCSVYGFLDEGVIADETSPTNPLTTYAKANYAAEKDVLSLFDDSFCVTVIRQATVYGYSPRMRFDLAINGMTYGAWKDGAIPLMRDGAQWRPMVHVRDTSAAMCLLLESKKDRINGETFNIGSDSNNYQLTLLAETVASTLPNDVSIEWYGDPDHRSYRVSFEKIKKIGFEAKYLAEDGVREIANALESRMTDKTDKTITLKWYQELIKWNKIINESAMNGSIIDQ
jgi:nucleoside-diphosphate-sugar epimerase